MHFKVSTPGLPQRRWQSRFVSSFSHSNRYNCVNRKTLFSEFRSRLLTPSIYTKMVSKLQNRLQKPCCCQSTYICLPVQNISDFKWISPVGTGDFSSVTLSIPNFSAEKPQAKKEGKWSELCDSRAKLVKFQRSNTLMSY